MSDVSTSNSKFYFYLNSGKYDLLKELCTNDCTIEEEKVKYQAIDWITNQNSKKNYLINHFHFNDVFDKVDDKEYTHECYLQRLVF